MNLKRKIIIVILEISIIPVILISFIGYSNLEKQITLNTFSKLEAIAQIQKNRMILMLNSQQELLNIYKSKPLFLSYLQAYNANPSLALQKSMSDNLIDAEGISNTIHEKFVTNTSGIVVASTDPTLIGKNISAEDYYIRGKENVNLATIIKDDEGGEDQYLSGPLEVNGESIGSIVIVKHGNEFVNIAKDYSGLGDTGETLLAKNDGQGNARFITQTRFNQGSELIEVPKEKTNIASVHAVAGEEGVFDDVVDYRGEKVFAVTRFIKDTNWGIVVKIDQSEALAPIKELQYLFLLLIGLIVIVVTTIGIITARSISKPLEKLTDVANKISEGDLSSDIQVTTNDEIGSLSMALKTMETKLNQSYSSLTDKVSDRTRELKNSNIAITNILEDLSVEKSNAVELAQDLEKFKLAVENSSDQVIITDLEGIAIYCNQAVENIAGYKPQEAVGKKAGTLWKMPMPKEYYQKFWHTIKTQKKPYSGEIQNKRKNGEIYTAHISVAPVLDKDKKIIYFVGIERDISREKAIDKAKTEFVSLASHQLRTPLTAIKWYSEMLQEDKNNQFSDAQKKYLQQVSDGNERMIRLVNALLNVSRLELGTFSVEPKPTDIVKLAESIAQELTPLLNTKKITLTQKYPKTFAKINTDPQLVQIVIENLLSNAIKYSPDNTTIELGITKGKDTFTVMVRDNGYGIPKAQQNKVFTKLFRADNVVTKTEEGTGLGLYMVKGIVEHAGGKIWFESVENKVTTFYVEMPLSGMAKRTGDKKIGQST